MTTAVRPGALADAEAILAVQAASWRATYAGLLPERLFPRAGDPGHLAFWRRVLMDGDTVTRVAVDPAGEVVGFVSAGGRRDAALPADGEIYALYLQPAARGRGLGRLLFHRAAAVLRARGARGLGLWVLAANAPARAFYAHLGGVAECRRDGREDGVTFAEVAYRWVPIARACD